MTKRILLVNSDKLLCRALADQLMARGFAVVEAASAQAALMHAASDSPDLVLVDGQSCDRSPVELCSALRGIGYGRPIIILGAGPAEAPVLKAAGASECIAKPIRLAGVAQRLRGHLRESAGDGSLPIGNFRFHPLARLMVDQRGKPVRLTEKEAAILAYLHRAGERVVPRDELLGEVWGYSNAASTHTVETHIYRLRRKLEEGNGQQGLLRTEEGGYRLADSA
jgi:DNA-binding response OmpR family regulator